jgi:hypothetical protein
MIQHNSNQMATSLPGSYLTATISMLVVPLHEILVPLLVLLHPMPKTCWLYPKDEISEEKVPNQ